MDIDLITENALTMENDLPRLESTSAAAILVPLVPFLLLLLAVGAVNAGQVADTPPVAWAYSTNLTADELTALCGRDGACLQRWHVADLWHDAGRDGLRGTVSDGIDYWVRDAETLADAARVWRSVGPLSRCERLEIEVWSPGAVKPRVVKDKELEWRGELDGDGLVVNLDVTNYWAIVPGLKIGDRLRVVWRWDWTAGLALPIEALCSPRGGGVLTTADYLVPVGDTVTFEYVGPDSLAALVRLERTVMDQRQRLRWECRDRRDATTLLAQRKGRELLVVPHLVAAATAPGGTFTAAGTWAEAAAAYRRRVEPLLEPTPRLKEAAAAICAGDTNVAGKIAALHAHVLRTTRYLGLFNGRGGIIPAAADATAAAGYGDCKGLSTYFIALCRGAGIPAWPVLVWSGDEDHIARTQPNLGQFNHFIAWVDDGRDGLWVDPTLEGYPAGQLVVEDGLNPVLTMRPGAEGLVRIPRAAWDPGLRQVEVTGAIDASLRLAGEVTLTATGPGAARLAWLAPAPGATRHETWVRELLLAPALRAGALPAGKADSSGATTWNRSFRAAQPLQGADQRRFVPALIAQVPELADGFTRDLDGLDPRPRPDRRESWRLGLPAGWMLAAADSVVVDVPGLAYRRVVRQEGDELRLERRVDWADTTVTGEQATALMAALARLARREANPFQLIRRQP